MTNVYISRDSAALARGAHGVVEAIQKAAATGGYDIEIIRNGSRGLFWLEPLVEVDTTEGRVAYGPVKPEDVPGLFESGLLEGGQHPLHLGSIEELPYFKNVNSN